MRYLIVDDEPIAHQIIDDYAAEVPFLIKAGQAYNAVEALELLNGEAVDLIFLDVRMPKLDGFGLLRTLATPPAVIAVTAHRDYALEAYDLNVVDYLLKPFGFERFLRAVNKVRETGEIILHETLFVKDGKKHRQVQLDEIQTIEAAGNYSVIHTDSGEIITTETLTELAAKLPSVFLRVHKSTIVATRRIELIQGDVLNVAGRRVSVGRSYKPGVHQLLAQSTPAHE